MVVIYTFVVVFRVYPGYERLNHLPGSQGI